MREGREVCCDSEPSLGSCCGSEKCDKIGQIREVSIRQVNYGYVVVVGCHTFAIESVAKLSEMLNTYLLKPNETEKQWYNGTLFK